MDVIAGTPTALIIPFIIGNQPVAPDVGSVTYTLKDQLGSPMVGLTDIPYVTTPTTYQMQVLVPSSAHSIDPARRFERRGVVVNFKLNGEEVQLTRSYRVVPEPTHTVTPADVRAFIGIEEHELPDSDIDILSAFLLVEKDVGATELAAAITSGTTAELSANTLVRMRAVLDVLPSAKQRMAQSEKNGVKEFSRVDLKELDKLKKDAEDRYQEAYDDIVVTTETTVSLFLVTSNTDAITG
ncbi:hypothetical protein IB276_32990 [Ensifer sp. ENS04]|uniref:hypothetical protein n=1 Tax=Ensifer sp. ENS04 TaxID=2769281 RepID=UPI001782EDD8|nr:hypothetical protein [Ensifer sp. ENS04]MBD9544263.1 hypothetical protein [Ensifer sp. ENS04]